MSQNAESWPMQPAAPEPHGRPKDLTDEELRFLAELRAWRARNDPGVGVTGRHAEDPSPSVFLTGEQLLAKLRAWHGDPGAAPEAPPSAPAADALGPIPTFPPRPLDDRGRLIPLSAEERRARSEAAVRVLALIQARPDDDPPEADRDVMRDIDSRRLPGHKLFEGMY